jgi:hypothetical protein
MSVQHANRGIVKKDLQLYYNREFQKSFRGEATSNLVMNSSDANYYQGLYQTIITPNAAIAPDGSNNAWSLAWNGTATTYNYYSKNFPIVSSTVYTTSVFAKAGTHDVIWMGISNMSGGENAASFNLTTGVATNASPASASFSMVYYGGGWWRCITTNTSGVTGATASAMTVSVGSNRATLGTVYFWGFQAERKSYVTTFLDSLNPIRNQVATNLYSADPYDGFDFVTAHNNPTNTGATISVISGITNPINAPTVMRYYTGTTGYQYFSLAKTGLASGTYTVSYYARLESGGPSALNNSQLWRDNVSDRAMDGDPNPTIYTYWRRFRVTALVTSGALYFFPIHSGSLTGGFTVYFTGFQLELGNEPTSFSPTTISTANTTAAGGGLLDISGNNYNIDLTSSAVSFDSGGYYFNSNAAGALTTPVANSVLDSLSNNTHTYECWIKLLGTPPGASDGYFFGRQGFHEGFAQFKSPSTTFGALSWYFDNSNTGWLSYAGSLNTWYHTAYVVDAENSIRYLYINGTLNSSGALTKQLKQYSSGTVYQLGSANPDYASNMIVSNAKAYNRALSATEILQNFNATRKTYGI